jgi:N-acetylneuraminate synthase/N,N'-diacetyllegionaminate synthase
MVNQIRNTEAALGDGIKRPNKSEIENAKVVLKSILAKRPIKKGELLTPDNLVVKRSSSGISSTFWDVIIGTKALFDYDIDDPIRLL